MWIKFIKQYSRYEPGAILEISEGNGRRLIALQYARASSAPARIEPPRAPAREPVAETADAPGPTEAAVASPRRSGRRAEPKTDPPQAAGTGSQ